MAVGKTLVRSKEQRKAAIMPMNQACRGISHSRPVTERCLQEPYCGSPLSEQQRVRSHAAFSLMQHGAVVVKGVFRQCEIDSWRTGLDDAIEAFGGLSRVKVGPLITAQCVDPVVCQLGKSFLGDADDSFRQTYSAYTANPVKVLNQVFHGNMHLAFRFRVRHSTKTTQ